MSDIFSTILGIASVIFAIVAIGQAWFYKNLQDRKEKEHEIFLNELRANLQYAFIVNRMMYRQMLDKGISFRKDEVNVYVTSRFIPSEFASNIENIEKLLKRVMKQCYSDQILKGLNLEDFKAGDLLCKVNMRRELNADDLTELESTSEELEKYGIYLSLLVNTN